MKLAIVEDDDRDKARLDEYVKRYSDENNVLLQKDCFDDGAQIVEAYARGEKYDVILMDIEMNQMDGIKAAECVRKQDRDVIIVYITNLAQFAIKGYEVGALDFMVKPVAYEMFRQKLKKAEHRITSREERFLIIHSRDGVFKIYTKELIYVEIRNHLVIFHTMKGLYQCTGSLRKIEQMVRGMAFSRCGASFLIHLSHVVKISGDYVIVTGEEHIPISRTKKKSFMQDLTDYYGGR